MNSMEPLREKRPLGDTGLLIPPIIFGSSALGNLYRELSFDEKRSIAAQWFATVEEPVVVDSAGKYGAGLALETLGRLFRDLRVAPEAVVISNKLGWKRAPLRGAEPTFEPGVWKGLAYDAEQTISPAGIRECWEQGCELLGEPYRPALASVHDPDEDLGAASGPSDRARRLEDIIGAYRALEELKASGEIRAVGLGAKDWRVIREIAEVVNLDWVMLACSLTVHTHPAELLAFVESLVGSGVGIINSAVFNAGFLIGGEYYDYRKPDPNADPGLFLWRGALSPPPAPPRGTPAPRPRASSRIRASCARFPLTRTTAPAATTPSTYAARSPPLPADQPRRASRSQPLATPRIAPRVPAWAYPGRVSAMAARALVKPSRAAR